MMEDQMKENATLKEENETLKNNYGILLDKYNDMVRRVSKLESTATPSEPPKESDRPAEISEVKGEALNIIDSIRRLQDAWSRADARMERHTTRLDDQDQYGKKNSLIINKLEDIPAKTYGLAFSKYVLNKLQQLLPSIADKIRIEDIDVSHPLPNTKKNKTRVIVKFVRRDIKNLVFFAKRELKNCPLKVTITEHLSQYNLWLLEKAREMVPFRDTWTSQCVVYALVHGKKVSIKGTNDLDFIYDKINNYSKTSNASSSTIDKDNSAAATTSLFNNNSKSSNDIGVANKDLAAHSERNAVIDAVKNISAPHKENV